MDSWRKSKRFFEDFVRNLNVFALKSIYLENFNLVFVCVFVTDLGLGFLSM